MSLLSTGVDFGTRLCSGHKLCVGRNGNLLNAVNDGCIERSAVGGGMSRRRECIKGGVLYRRTR